MPAKTERQRRLFSVALGVKRGDIDLSSLPRGLREKVKRIVDEMAEEEIRKYVKKRRV